MRLAELEGDPEHVQLFGTRGQDQSGIDVFSRLSDGDYATYQCRRVKNLTPAGITGAIDHFLDGEWSSKSSRFVFCTAHSLTDVNLAREFEAQSERLKSLDQPITLEGWDAEILSRKLKAHPGLVEDFFGSAWLERFSRPAAQRSTSERLEAIQEGVDDLRSRSIERIPRITFDWTPPERLRRALKDLEDADSALFARLTDQVGSPPNPDLISASIEGPPAWVREAGNLLWAPLARLAESEGLWAPASLAWEETAECVESSTSAGHLVSAAVASQLAGDADRADELLNRARSLDPNHPQVKLEEIPDGEEDPSPELEALKTLESDDPDIRALIAARTALASMRVPDLETARECLETINQNSPGSTMARAVSANLALQQGRLDLLAGRPLDTQELRGAHRDALTLRDRLLRERRFAEAARLLMIATDALCLLGERSEASDLLAQATEDELDSEDGAEVLADAAASRALNFKLALEILEHADAETPTVERLRAEALEEVGNAEQRQEALDTLDRIVRDRGPEASAAAFVRLAATLGARETPWSDEAAAYLVETGHERAAITAEVFYRARWHRDFEFGEQALQPHLDEMWARMTLLRLRMTRKDNGLIVDAADDLMRAGPSQSVRVEAGRAYARAGNFDRALEVLLGPAREPSAPPLDRAEAYRLLVRIAGLELEDWTLASKLHSEWTELSPGDPNASAWAPTIANRLRRRAPQ